MPHVARASAIDELKEKIELHNNTIKSLEGEIKTYKEQIDITEGEARTLEGAVRTLDVTDRKLSTDLRLTDQKIEGTNSSIEKLKIEIGRKEADIGQNTAALAAALRRLNELESRSLVEIMLAHTSLSRFWSAIEGLSKFQSSVHAHLSELYNLKADLEAKKAQSEKERTNLISLENRLADQKNIVKWNKREKERLLRDTENKESNYRKLLEDRLALKEALEKEIEEFEARLRVEIDPESLPPTGTGILSWPLSDITVTQYFGNTPFASKNPQVYNGGGHNGVDFRAAVGTSVLAAAAGVVTDAGDTDEQCYKASYGKWALVRHYNGLSTLYAHLSLVNVEEGSEVGKGDVIGYSGNTGYSTGPHLHFGAFATQAVRVTDEYKSRVCGTNLKLPISPKNGYLNPLSYLPELDA